MTSYLTPCNMYWYILTCIACPGRIPLERLGAKTPHDRSGRSDQCQKGWINLPPQWLSCPARASQVKATWQHSECLVNWTMWYNCFRSFNGFYAYHVDHTRGNVPSWSPNKKKWLYKSIHCQCCIWTHLQTILAQGLKSEIWMHGNCWGPWGYRLTTHQVVE